VGFFEATLDVTHDGLPPQHTYPLRGTSIPARTETSLLTSPANGSVFGEAVTLSVVVTSPLRTPGGTISFTEGGATMPHLMDIPLSSGIGSQATTASPAGT